MCRLEYREMEGARERESRKKSERGKVHTHRSPRNRWRQTDIAHAEISNNRARVKDAASEEAKLPCQDGDVHLGPVGVVDDLPIAGAEEIEEAGEWESGVRGVRMEVDGEGDGAGAAAAAVDGDVVVQDAILKRGSTW